MAKKLKRPSKSTPPVTARVPEESPAPAMGSAPTKVRRNLHIPTKLDMRVRAKCRELGYTLGTGVLIALHEWVTPPASDPLDHRAHADHPPAVRYAKPAQPEPVYTFSHGDGTRVTVPWSFVKQVGTYWDAHPKALPGKIAAALKLPIDEVEAAFDACVTEWYADQLEREERA